MNFFFNNNFFPCVKFCNACKQDNIHSKNIKITQLPEVLILSLERINMNFNIKINEEISFEDILDMKRYCDELFLKEKKYFYNLF